MDEHGVKIRYAQPQHTTHFMNRKITMPKKSVSGISQNNNNEPASADRDVTSQSPIRGDHAETSTLNADLDIERVQNSAIFTGLAGLNGSQKSKSPTKER